ncbi:hypothetical protein F66182_7646 [Fusarium sp. NRRL 66182]|nr:hypothetical protein F66182_7646 [Fusarium sp. NRRL 66182]
MPSSFSVEDARTQFPALARPQVFGDNAGGSQVLGTVAKRQLGKIRIMTLGASYKTSTQSTSIFDNAYKAAAKYVNAGVDEIVIGASTTQVLRNLAAALKLEAGDEVILSEVDHESNIDPWLHYAALTGATVKWWTCSNSKNPKLDPATLRSLLTSKTRLVACTHSSNILGTIHDIRAIADVVHEIPGALLAVDGVAYAPHRAVDVEEFGADFYAFSWYKVYGPHISLLYASKAAQAQLTSLGHYFNPSGSLMDKLELAGASYELTQAIIPLVAYFGEDPKQTWAAIAEHEEKLQKRLIEYLVSRPEITVYGETCTKNSVRVPTVSFTVEARSSQSVVEAVEAVSHVGIRWGHFFSKRLAEKILGLSDDGVVRVSLVHYNTDFTEFEGGAYIGFCLEALSVFGRTAETKHIDTVSLQEIQIQEEETPTPNSTAPTLERSTSSSPESSKSSSVLGVNSHRRNKPLPPIVLDDTQDTTAMKRARNTMAVRKSRERKARRLLALEERVKKLEADRDHWKSIAIGRLSVKY